MNGHHMARPGMGSAHLRGRASKRWLRGRRATLQGSPTSWGLQRGEEPVSTQKECDRMKGTHLWRPQRKGYEEGDLARGTHELGPADRERMRLRERHSPLETAEG